MYQCAYHEGVTPRDVLVFSLLERVLHQSSGEIEVYLLQFAHAEQDRCVFHSYYFAQLSIIANSSGSCGSTVFPVFSDADNSKTKRCELSADGVSFASFIISA